MQETVPLRVLQLIDSLERAGAEQSLVAMAPHLVAAGVELHVGHFASTDGLRRALESAGATVHPLADRGRSRAQHARAASGLVGELHPDVVHTTLFEADLAGRPAAARHRVPCVSSLVNTAYGARESAGLSRAKTRAAHLSDLVTGLTVTRWHAISRHVAEVMGRRLRIPASRIDVIPRGREAADLGTNTPDRRARVRAELGLAPATPVLLNVGRQERQKGQDVLLRALPEVLGRHPDLVLLMAGREGGQSAQLRALVRELGLSDHVRMLGVRTDVPDLMVASDLLAFPSRWEGAGGTLLEAMALRCPVVATSHPAVLEALDPETAVLVPVDAAPELAQGLLAALGDADATAHRVNGAQRRFERDFTVSAVAARMVGLYASVSAAGRAGRRR